MKRLIATFAVLGLMAAPAIATTQTQPPVKTAKAAKKAAKLAQKNAKVSAKAAAKSN